MIHSRPIDGMPFSDGALQCPCGLVIRLWWNGGELDGETCKCGRKYWTEHVSTVLRVKDID